MALAGLVIAVASLVVAVLVALGLEWLKRPRLEIESFTWQPRSPVLWTFAAVLVYNRPLPILLRMFLVRQSANSCEVALEFRNPGNEMLAIPVVAGRWSTNPEPLRELLLTDAEGKQSLIMRYDATLASASKRLDVPAGDSGQEVAVAVLLGDGTAYAFGAESYVDPTWKVSDWALNRQIYEVTVRLRASGITAHKRFHLDNLSADFSAFSRLQIPSKGK